MMYQNIDFGTVKGFSASYDLRRTGRVQMTTNYTAICDEQVHQLPQDIV